MRSILKKIFPNQLRIFLRNKLDSILRNLKAPKMIWGYQDSSGEWRSRTRISDTVFFYHPENILIEDNVFVWHYTILDGTGGLEIGEGCQIGAWVGIFTHSSHIAIRIYGNHYQEVPENEKIGYKIAPVKIGKYVFIGAGAKILPGITIGNGALISAGAVVTKNIGDFEIVSGNPAEVVGDTRKLDKRYLKDSQLLEWYDEWQNN
ncbi:MAG: acyltransferase [Nostocales cyanobacterium 94392]|nr:acyltransferase [Nostocales cyanobacterium 94392]